MEKHKRKKLAFFRPLPVTARGDRSGRDGSETGRGDKEPSPVSEPSQKKDLPVSQEKPEGPDTAEILYYSGTHGINRIIPLQEHTRRSG